MKYLTNDTATYKHRKFIPIVPFLCQITSESIERSKGGSKKLLLEVLFVIKTFDTRYDANTEYN